MPDGLEGQAVGVWDARRAEMRGEPLPAYNCPACKDLGWVRWDTQPGRPHFGQMEPCAECGANRRLQWLTEYCGLEGAALQVRLHDWRRGEWADARLIRQREEAKAAMEAAILTRVGLLTFWGDFGAGKTMALQIIVNELRLKGIESYYASFAHLLDHLRRAIRTDGSFWQRLLDVPVLAIDEVTRFNETPWARERLWMLADKRYERQHSHLTLFATNDDPNEVLPTTEDVGYLYSRMREGCVVELRGDMRLAAKEKRSV